MELQTDKLGKVSITVEEGYWDINKDYDKLTVVEKEGTFGTFISRKPVPAGTELTNRNYWIPFSSLKEEILINYNAFLDKYQDQLDSYDEAIEEFRDKTVEVSDKLDKLKEGLELIDDIKDSVIVLNNHLNNKNNPHNVTKAQVGLGNVDNTADIDKPISTAVRTEFNNHNTLINKVKAQIAYLEGNKGRPYGIASLDSNGHVPSSQLPSYVDDVLEFANKSKFPTTGETGKIYVDTTTNLTYRWGGSQYIEISPSLALGETSSTAYSGDKGKATTDRVNTHVANTTNPHNVTKAQVGLGNVDNTADIDKPISTAVRTEFNNHNTLINNILNSKNQHNGIAGLDANSKIYIDQIPDSIKNHPINKNNPHAVTKAQIGLNNVTNDAQVKRSEIGVANGVATLDSSGKVPTSQLPANIGGSSLEIGETTGTAYDGAKGKKNADDIIALTTTVGNKVDKVTGKGLSTNDYTNEDKTKLNNIEANANNYVLPAATENVKGGITLAAPFMLDENGHLMCKTASTTQTGLMSTEDKEKLDNIDIATYTTAGLVKTYSNPPNPSDTVFRFGINVTDDGKAYIDIPATQGLNECGLIRGQAIIAHYTTNKFYLTTERGYGWVTVPDATTNQKGLMTASDKIAVNGINTFYTQEQTGTENDTNSYNTLKAPVIKTSSIKGSKSADEVTSLNQAGYVNIDDPLEVHYDAKFYAGATIGSINLATWLPSAKSKLDSLPNSFVTNISSIATSNEDGVVISWVHRNLGQTTGLVNRTIIPPADISRSGIMSFKDKNKLYHSPSLIDINTCTINTKLTTPNETVGIVTLKTNEDYNAELKKEFEDSKFNHTFIVKGILKTIYIKGSKVPSIDIYVNNIISIGKSTHVCKIVITVNGLTTNTVYGIVEIKLQDISDNHVTFAYSIVDVLATQS